MFWTGVFVGFFGGMVIGIIGIVVLLILMKGSDYRDGGDAIGGFEF